MTCRKKKLHAYERHELLPYGLFPNGVPRLTPPFGDRKQWLVQEAFTYIDREGNIIVVDKAFLTDLASIPRFLRAIFGVNKRETVGAVIHDFGYRNQKLAVYNIFSEKYVVLRKEDWDGILSDVMKLAKTKPIREKAIAAGIWCFGWIGWNGNQKK